MAAFRNTIPFWPVDGLKAIDGLGRTMQDSGVRVSGDSMLGLKVHLVVTGGIAAVETVRLARELRRHGAQIIVTMTSEAKKIITPLAVGWATDGAVNSEWSSDLPGLSVPDVVLVAPATRNTLSKISRGAMDDPAMMAIAAASGAQKPVVLVPSMHDDLFDDPVTSDLLEDMERLGHHLLISPSDEGRRKQPPPDVIVRRTSSIVNGAREGTSSVAVIYGATEAKIDPVRVITNASSGRTGVVLSDHLERMGHRIIRVAGATEYPGPYPDIVARTPMEMIEAVDMIMEKQIPDVWIVAAAVLDYQPIAASAQKISSGLGGISIDLEPAPRLLHHIKEASPSSRVLSFKLETGVTPDELIARSRSHLEASRCDAVVANLMEHLHGAGPRGYLVTPEDEVTLHGPADLCRVVESMISRWSS